MAQTTAQLRKALAKGAKIVAPAQPYNGAEVAYEPRNQRDRAPWTYQGYRFSAGELAIEWGPLGEPVKLTDTQADFLRACISHKSWENGGGWMWANRSTSLRLAAALERKGLLICTSDRPYRERYAASDLAYRLHDNQYPRPDEATVRVVLVMMAEQSGEWSPGCGWHYKNEGVTRLALEALYKDGYVNRSGNGYAMRSPGFDAARAAGWDETLLGDDEV